MELELIKERFLGKKDIWDMDFKEPKFSRGLTMAFSSKHRGSVRLATGLFYTDDEWKKIREKALRTSLP